MQEYSVSSRSAGAPSNVTREAWSVRFQRWYRTLNAFLVSRCRPRVKKSSLHAGRLSSFRLINIYILFQNFQSSILKSAPVKASGFRFETKLEPKEELMIAIRTAGGRQALRKVGKEKEGWLGNNDGLPCTEK